LRGFLAPMREALFGAFESCGWSLCRGIHRGPLFGAVVS
jgi:hypothetical protein